MTLPSLSDVFFVIVLLIPGFLTLAILRRIAIFETELSDLHLTIWSLLLSLIIFGSFSWYTGFTDFNTIRDSFLLPQNLVCVFSASVLLGIIPGLIIKYLFRRGIVRGDTWEVCMNQASKSGSWVIIYTVKGQEYLGKLHYSGGKKFPKEVSIRDPKQIFRDSNGSLEEKVAIGNEMLFSEKDIARIAFFKEV